MKDMKIAINNNPDEIMYYNKDTFKVYNNTDILRINIDDDNIKIKLLSRILTINKILNNADYNALEIILSTNNINIKDFKYFYCNKYKTSESTANRALNNLQISSIIYINKNDEICLYEQYSLKDKTIDDIKIINLEFIQNCNII